MIVRKLRERKNWSQEQLAEVSGVSLRTIQRVEAGNKASLETLKSLASVFEVDISKLTEEIIVIDKKTEEWKSEPWPLRMFMLGARRRSQLLVWEFLFLFLGILYWFLIPSSIATPIVFISAYITSKLLSHVDKKGYW